MNCGSVWVRNTNISPIQAPSGCPTAALKTLYGRPKRIFCGHAHFCLLTANSHGYPLKKQNYHGISWGHIGDLKRQNCVSAPTWGMHGTGYSHIAACSPTATPVQTYLLDYCLSAMWTNCTYLHNHSLMAYFEAGKNLL